jgi:hypothetical protein
MNLFFDGKDKTPDEMANSSFWQILHLLILSI